jgi:hypothetical protein
MVAPVNAVKKKLAGGKETTSKGGRPTVPSQRKATQAEVVRLRGGGLTFQAIADELGISDRQAQILWDEYWEREHALSQESAEDVRISILTRLRLLRDTALAMATNPKVKISSTDPTGCTIELADFEKMAKMGKLALGCMTEEAKLCAAYDKPIEKEQPNVLSLIKFAELADKFCAENPNS